MIFNNKKLTLLAATICHCTTMQSLLLLASTYCSRYLNSFTTTNLLHAPVLCLVPLCLVLDCQHLHFYLIYLQPHIYTPVCCVNKTIAKSYHQLHHVSPSVCLSVCPSAWIRANPTRQIFMNLRIWEFYNNL